MSNPESSHVEISAQAVPTADAKSDRLSELVIAIVLGSIALSVVIGGIVLALRDKTLTDALIGLGSVAVGALAKGNMSRR